MNRMLALLLGACLAVGCSAPKDTSYFAIDTPKGRIVVRLFDETPQHRDNFRKLAAEGYYDGTLFHRIIRGFMVQGGDPLSRDDQDPSNDGMGGPSYRIPAEILPALFHRKGALAAARDNNPEMASSGSQFYIVHGDVVPDSVLTMMEARMSAQLQRPFTFSPEARQAYTTIGGAPWLDGQYTVFGEVVEGLDVVDSLAVVPTPRSSGIPAPPQFADRPNEPMPMTVVPLPGYEPKAP